MKTFDIIYKLLMLAGMITIIVLLSVIVYYELGTTINIRNG